MKQPSKVGVLLAAYNATEWLMPQIKTLLSQKDVNIDIFISLDLSNDGSETWIKEHIIPLAPEQIHLLPYGEEWGSAAKNFYHLIRTVDFEPYDYIAFSDQDDLWNDEKLSHAINQIETHNVKGYSSNVIAFWPNGKEKLIKKNYPQTPYDYFFESAGPGCTYVIRKATAQKFQEFLNDHLNLLKTIDFHDWLIYAFIRSHHLKWLIDSYPSMKYRQHDNNVLGARRGLSPLKQRFQQIHSGWYRSQILVLTKLFETEPELYPLIKRNRFMDRIKLVSMAIQFRRKKTDAILLAIFIFLNLW